MDKETKVAAVLIRLTKAEHAKIKEVCAKERRSISEMVLWLFEKYINKIS